MGMEEYLDDYKAEAKEHLGEINESLLKLEKDSSEAEAINKAFRAMHTLKSMSATMGFNNLSSFCHKMEDLLSIARTNQSAITKEMIDVLFESLDLIEKFLQNAKIGEDKFEFSQILKKLENMNTAQENPAPETVNKQKPQDPAVDVSESTHSVRVSMEKLDMLLNLAGELVINKNRLLQIMKIRKAKEFREALNDYDKFVTQIHDEILNARLIPAEQVFNKFPRMVRDLAKSEGKEIDFEMRGASIELDRTILEKISNPIVHLLRNAIDHGIEEAQKRKKAGKNPIGKIIMGVQRNRSRAVISVEDDGGGIDSDEIKNIALAKNLITKEQAKGILKDDAFQLLFLPGLSSSIKVSETSGRGVGLNAVKAALVQLGGSIEIYSQKGKGSRFEMSFPLSVAIVNSLLVVQGGSKFAIPLSHIARSASIKSLKIKEKGKKQFTSFGAEEVPLISISQLFGVENSVSGELRKVLLLESGSKKIAVIVDDIAERQGLLIKPLDIIVQKNRLFTGAAVLGTGEIALVVDVPALFEKYELNLA